jgi:hypothetical protein
MSGDQVAEVIRTSRVAARLDQGVEATGPQARERLQGFQDERQVEINRRGPANRDDAGQTRLGEDTVDGLTMNTQLAGDGADRPVFGMVVAQYLHLKVGGNGHEEASASGMASGPGCAGSPGVPVPATAGRGNGRNTGAISERLALPPVQQRPPQARNPDASLSGSGHGSDVGVRHGPVVLDGRSGSVLPPPAPSGAGPPGRSPRRNSGGRDRRRGR